MRMEITTVRGFLYGRFGNGKRPCDVALAQFEFCIAGHPERVKRVEGSRGIADDLQKCLIVTRECGGVLRSLGLPQNDRDFEIAPLPTTSIQRHLQRFVTGFFSILAALEKQQNEARVSFYWQKALPARYLLWE